MPEQHSFEYAVIRVVPKVEREEFMNVGVILYCQSLSFLDALFTLNEERLRALSPGLEMTEIKKHLQLFVISVKEGPMADRSASWIWVPVFAGLRPHAVRFCNAPGCIPDFQTDPALTLKSLHKRLVEGE